jgi:hypothetical protein
LSLGQSALTISAILHFFQVILPINLLLFPQVVQGTCDVHQLVFAHMQVALRGLYVEVAKQLFDVLDVCAFIQQVCGKAVAQAVYAYFLADASFVLGLVNTCCTVRVG